MLGAVPRGSASVPLSAHASPPVQGWPNIALVMAPISDLATLAMVLVWNEPSRVSLHLMVEKEVVNSSAVQLALKLCSLVERVLAVAVAVMAASRMVAAVMAVSHWVVRLFTVLPPVGTVFDDMSVGPLLERGGPTCFN